MCSGKIKKDQNCNMLFQNELKMFKKMIENMKKKTHRKSIMKTRKWSDRLKKRIKNKRKKDFINEGCSWRKTRVHECSESMNNALREAEGEQEKHSKIQKEIKNTINRILEKVRSVEERQERLKITRSSRKPAKAREQNKC